MSPIHPQRLFTASCFALIATSVAFAVVGASMAPLKSEFLLSNGDVGWIGGAGLWGFTLSIFIFGPLVDMIGMKPLLRFASLCHLLGVATMVFAGGFSTLLLGALIIAIGNGTVEAVCNPLVATLYPDRKTQKLNQFHMWFPGGIVIGSLLAYGLDAAGLDSWRIKMALIVIPAVICTVLISGQRFPATERVQTGISFGGMLRAAFTQPLFYLLLFTMALTASLELGPGRWIPAVLTAGGIPGILVLAYINGLMAVLRFYAGPVVHRFSPTGVLMGSAVLGGLGLLWFSFSSTVPMAFASATVFAVGVCYFWPTMLGLTSERLPRTGSLGLAMVGGMGMLVVGLVTSPTMGTIADKHLLQQLDAAQTVAALQEVVDTYPPLAADMPDVHRKEVLHAVEMAQCVIQDTKADGRLPAGKTADALRAVTANAPDAAAPLRDRIATELLGPADNHGGRMSFRFITPAALILLAIFVFLHLRFRNQPVERIDTPTG